MRSVIYKTPAQQPDSQATADRRAAAIAEAEAAGEVLIADHATLDGTWELWFETPDPLEVNRRTIEEALALDLVALQAIIDDTNANINANPAPRIKTQARALRRITKLLLNDLTTAE